MRYAAAFVLVSLVLGWPAFSTSAQTEPRRGALVEQFLARVDESLTQYRAVRRLTGRNERFKKEGQLEAVTTLDPRNGFSYEVLTASGSPYVRTHVLEPILRGEAKAFAEGGGTRAALTLANYDFVPMDIDVEPYARVLIRPRRKETLLVDGSILVTASDADLVRIEGRLAKNPSFWTSRVEIAREYARVGGVRVPVRVESQAWVKIAGPSTFVMTYEYDEINGRSVPPAGETQ
jgi:hypothetical protein